MGGLISSGNNSNRLGKTGFCASEKRAVEGGRRWRWSNTGDLPLVTTVAYTAYYFCAPIRWLVVGGVTVALAWGCTVLCTGGIKRGKEI